MSLPAHTKIYIIGGGAVGKALAVSLAIQDRNVTLVRGRKDGIPSQMEEITVDMGDNQVIRATVEVTSFSELNEMSGIIVVSTKSYANDTISQKLRNRAGNSPIVILQNGLMVEKEFLEAGFPEVYRCVLFMTSQFRSESVISYKPVAPSPVGTIRSNADLLKSIVGIINVPHFQFRAEEKIQTVIWKKAILNSVFNSICPLLDIDNGIFHRDKEVLQLAREVIRECVELAGHLGISLTEEEVEERALFISKTSDGQLISTLQDIRNGRPTEINSLNLEIARQADAIGRSNLVSRTRLLGELLHMKSQIHKK